MLNIAWPKKTYTVEYGSIEIGPWRVGSSFLKLMMESGQVGSSFLKVRNPQHQNISLLISKTDDGIGPGR